MSYDLHIEKSDGSPISVDEWKAAVQSLANLRLSDGTPVTGTNPRTGEKISVSISTLDAELHFPDDDRYDQIAGRWFPIFFYSLEEGSVRFKATVGIEDEDHAVHVAAAALVRTLGAEIRGDGGELYEW